MSRPVSPNSLPTKVDLLLELETRQDEVLLQLADLEARVGRVLAEFVATIRPEQAKAA